MDVGSGERNEVALSRWLPVEVRAPPGTLAAGFAPAGHGARAGSQAARCSLPKNWFQFACHRRKTFWAVIRLSLEIRF